MWKTNSMLWEWLIDAVNNARVYPQGFPPLLRFSTAHTVDKISFPSVVLPDGLIKEASICVGDPSLPQDVGQVNMAK